MEDDDIAPNMYITADPVGMGRTACLYTILENSVLARLSAHTGLDQLYVGTYLAQYPGFPFCVLFYCIYNLLFYGVILVHGFFFAWNADGCPS